MYSDIYLGGIFVYLKVSFAFLDNGVTLLQVALKHKHTIEEIRLGNFSIHLTFLEVKESIQLKINSITASFSCSESMK